MAVTEITVMIVAIRMTLFVLIWMNLGRGQGICRSLLRVSVVRTTAIAIASIVLIVHTL